MNKLEQSALYTKNFVKKHRVAIAITGTTLVCLKLNRLALKQHDAFLEEKGLYDEFYFQEE